MKQRSCQEIQKWEMKAQEAEQCCAHAGLALPSPSAALAASPEHPRECSGTAHSHQRVQKGAHKELWHCLTEQAASYFYTWFPRKLNGMKRRSIAFCFEVLNMSFPASPAGTKVIEWRQSAWFSWYPTAVTLLLPELLTHAAMQQESYFSKKSSEERFIALQKSNTEPLDVFAKCSPAFQCCGCFSMGWFVAQSIERGSAWTPSLQ